MEYWIGVVTGCGLGIFATLIASSDQKTLDNCAKTHNVYQCEMVAVPVENVNER